MNKAIVVITHPFTPSAVGIPEDKIPLYHSKPHVKAMGMLSLKGYDCQMEYFSDKIFPYTVTGKNVKWIFWPVSKRWSGDHRKWKKQWSILQLIRYFFQTPDVTIINMSGHSSPYSMKLAKLILWKRKKYVAMLGGQHLTLDKARIEYYKNANHILVHTNLQKKYMEGLNEFSDCKIDVFPLGVDCDLFKPEMEKQFSAPSLLFVGRIVDWKRIHLGIEALSLLHNNGFKSATFTIIGPTSSDSYYKSLIELIEEKKLTESVNFVGFVEHDELLEYYNKANIFLLPSDHETFGMVMIESMSCGIPVVGIDCPGGPKDVIRNGYDGLLTSVEDYGKAVLNIFNTPGLLENLSENARNTALSKYSISSTYDALINSVERCVGDE